MLKPLLLSLLFVPKRSRQSSDVVPSENITNDSDVERAAGENRMPAVTNDTTDNDIPNTDDDLDDILDNVEELDPDVDPDDEADGPDDVVSEPPRWSRRFLQRSLSFSHKRTISSLSAFIETRRRNISLDYPPFSWFRKLIAYLRSSDPVSNDYLPHYRITPIFSGVIVPFSILLAIPGFTEHWYIRTHENKTVETQKNPVILDTGLAFSMLCAVIANICLVLRFMEKRVRTMTLLCVIFLSIHDIINIIAITMFGVIHAVSDGFTYGQSFWMTVCSTIASIFTNVTLIVDLIRTPDFSKSGSGLTRKQCSLVIVVIILLCYIALGALINSFLERLTFINALYFTIVTIETIGFGDITPVGTGTRLFVGIYTVFGILNLALLVGVMRETVLEGVEISYRKRLQAVQAKRANARMRRKVAARWREAVEWRLREVGAPIWVKDDVKSSRMSHLKGSFALVVNWLRSPFAGSSGRYRNGLGYADGQHPHGMHLGLEALTRAQLQAAAMEAGVPLETLLPPGFDNFADARSTNSSVSQRTGEGIIAGITGLWREMRSRDGQEDVEGQPTLTHARMGRMIAMLGRFALAFHGMSRDPPEPPHSIRLPGAPHVSHSIVQDPEKTDGGEAQDASVIPEIRLEQPTVDRSILENGNGTQLPEQPMLIAHKTSYPLSLHDYDSYRIEMENEEKRAFLGRLGVVWVLFILFWAMGSAVFVRTEGWPLGTAIYFCFITFTTIGYGDWAPETPAGRSVFVVWALLGVGTMTILISVLSEAYSFTYKHALLHTHVFDTAVKRYRQRSRKQQQRPTLRHQRSESGSEIIHGSQPSFEHSHDPSYRATEHFNSRSCSPSFDRHARAQRKLEALPLEILQNARTFHEQVQFFIGKVHHKDGGGVLERLPPAVRELLNDISGPEPLGEKILADVLHDDNVRKTLFALSIERQLRKFVKAAKDTLDVMQDRDNTAAPSFMVMAMPEPERPEQIMFERGSRRVSRRPSFAGELNRSQHEPSRYPTPILK